LLKKYSQWFKTNKNKLIGKMIIIILVATIVTLTINLFKGKSILENSYSIIFLIAIFLFSLLISKYISSIWLQFVSSFVVVFILLSIQMFIDGSYVDYTSFIIIGGVALFLTFMILIIVKALLKVTK